MGCPATCERQEKLAGFFFFLFLPTHTNKVEREKRMHNDNIEANVLTFLAIALPCLCSLLSSKKQPYPCQDGRDKNGY